MSPATCLVHTASFKTPRLNTEPGCCHVSIFSQSHQVRGGVRKRRFDATATTIDAITAGHTHRVSDLMVGNILVTEGINAGASYSVLQLLVRAAIVHPLIGFPPNLLLHTFY